MGHLAPASLPVVGMDGTGETQDVAENRNFASTEFMLRDYSGQG